MAHIVILGAGIGGLPMAYDMRKHARKEDRITVISNVDYFHFVPSNPWIAVNWRKRDDIAFPFNNHRIAVVERGLLTREVALQHVIGRRGRCNIL